MQEWLDAYVEAWRTYDRDAVVGLFSAGASYAYHPYDDEPLRGRDAILASWLERAATKPAAGRPPTGRC